MRDEHYTLGNIKKIEVPLCVCLISFSVQLVCKQCHAEELNGNCEIRSVIGHNYAKHMKNFLGTPFRPKNDHCNKINSEVSDLSIYVESLFSLRFRKIKF